MPIPKMEELDTLCLSTLEPWGQARAGPVLSCSWLLDCPEGAGYAQHQTDVMYAPHLC